MDISASVLAVVLFIGFGSSAIGQPPSINLSELPVPGKPLKKAYVGSEDSQVTLYEYKYTPRGYSFTIRWSDDRVHIANGTLTDVKGTKMYIEQGGFTEFRPNDQTCQVEYIIDENGYRDLNKTECLVSTVHVSQLAIGSILG